MSTPTKNKRVGAEWERRFRDYMRRAKFKYEQLRTTGKFDEGDAVIMVDGQPIVLELKAGALHAADFVRQAKNERDTYAERRGLDPKEVKCLAVIKARGKTWKEAYVLTTVSEYFGV